MRIEFDICPCDDMVCDHPKFPDCKEPADLEVWEEEKDDSGISHYMCPCCFLSLMEESVANILK